MTARFLAAALACLTAAAAWGQQPCDVALREAERSLREGRIDDVYPVREACLDSPSDRAQQIRAWTVLAKAYAADDKVQEAAEAIRALLALSPDFTPAPNDPFRFGRLVEREKEALAATRVATVSKVDEPLREAPATVIVVTAEEIERRGYLDLEELLHDLPGFDVSRGNGDVYSNVSMRGYRSDRSDRMLFLVDGVEQNDLHSNTVYLSRQYPLSNVDQVEVVYGPASTIYGPNAFTGVISVTTKRPATLLEEGRNLGYRVEAGGGSFDTGYLDVTVAGRTPGGAVSWSLTGRSFRSDEQDLSEHADWDYDPSIVETLDYQAALRLEGAVAQALAGVCRLLPDECELVTADDGTVVAIQPTPGFAEVARESDRQLVALLQGEEGLGVFSDETDDWAIDGKLQVQNLTLGLQSWRRQEGTAPWYSDILRAGGPQNVWTPRETAVYARYSRPLGGNLRLNFFSRFKQHETDGDSSLSRLVTTATQAISLIELAVFNSPSSLQEITFDQKSSQIRNELTLVYQPSAKLNVVGGVELRNSSVQLDFKSEVSRQAPIDETAPYLAQVFFLTQATESKTEVTDLGIFAQASYKIRDDFKIVVGGRLDDNSVRSEEAVLSFDKAPAGEFPEGVCELLSLGPFPCDLTSESVPVPDSGSVFNPRLALVHTRGDFVLKAIYAEAFKDASNFQRFTREPGVRDFPSSGLLPEKVENFELALSWQPRADLAVDVAAYQASYDNAVALKQTVPDEILEDPLNVLEVFPILGGQFKNLGRLRIRGAQLNARARFGLVELFGNYTFTDPKNLDPADEVGDPRADVDEVRIGDIASHRLNLGVDLTWRDRIDLNLRTNWVGERETGAGTTVDENPLSVIDDYFVAHATVGYRGWPAGATWQLTVRNLFDAEYEHPGVQRAGAGFASALPQPGRTFFFRLLYKR